MDEKAFAILRHMADLDGDCIGAVDRPTNALTITNIMARYNDETLSSESTVYKNVMKLLNSGYLAYGIRCGRANTYYVTRKGFAYVESVLPK